MAKKIDYKKVVLFWSGIFLVGGLAGVLVGQVFLPWISGVAPFNKISWMRNLKDGTTIINQTEKIYITQDIAYQDAIARVGNLTVAVQVLRNDKILAEGSGFILTSDGLAVTADALLIKGFNKILIWRDGQSSEAQVLKQDKVNGLALLKINENNLPVVTFGEPANLRLGEMVFLTGANQTEESFVKLANVGFVEQLMPAIILTFNAAALTNGGPASNIKGEVFGLGLVDKNGIIELVEAEKIRELMK